MAAAVGGWKYELHRWGYKILVSFIIIIILFIYFYFLFSFSPASTKTAGLKIVKLDIFSRTRLATVVEKNYVSGKVLLNATALPRWSDTVSLW